MVLQKKDNAQIIVLELDLSNEKLALEELKILAGKTISVNNGHALIEVRKTREKTKTRHQLPLETYSMLKRLAFSRAGYLYLFSAKNAKDLDLEIAKFDWKKIFKKDFSFRKKEGFCKTLKVLSEQHIGGAIWDALESQATSPKLNLKKPTTPIEAIELDKEIIFMLRVWERESFESRRPIKRKGFHPSGIHPKLARACINISGELKGRLLDPFCGSGGILIESRLLGFETYGIDCDEVMIDKCKKNLSYLALKANVRQGDAFKVKGNYDLVVTDPPYGKNSSIKGDKKNADEDKIKRINLFYIKFLKNIKKNTSNIVMVFPHFANWNKIIKESGWFCNFSTEIYVHKSLSRIITHLKKFN